MNFGWGGFGRRGWSGGGHRHRHWFYATGLPGWARGYRGGFDERQYVGAAAPFANPEELTLLKQQIEDYENALSGLRKRVATLEGGPKVETE
jgi:hypothetical protein